MKRRLNKHSSLVAGDGNAPRVSVILSTYRGERFLAEAVDSILGQTFVDFELIIIDDNGNLDNHDTQKILRSFTDRRIVIITNSQNLGYATSLNKGIAAAQGSYVAIQEHDDISLPKRLEQQVQYLDAHHETGFVSSGAIVIDETGQTVGIRHEHCADIELKWLVLWGPPVLHGIIMFRRSLLENVGCYSEAPRHSYSLDYEILSRVLKQYQGANLQEHLFKYRRHRQSLSSINELAQSAQGLEIVRENICTLTGEDRLTRDVWAALKAFMLSFPTDDVDLSARQLVSVVSFLKLMEARFYASYNFDRNQARSHRRGLYWEWARHCLTLSYRQNGNRNLRSRATALVLGLCLVKEVAVA
jgi:glycosyltransferase involved in cell wall biosynthesis